MRLPDNISEIRAEVLLNYLYPELEEKWTARYEGTFYRNYNRDALEINADEAEVSLARDGLLRLLPQGMLTREDELKKGSNARSAVEVERRLHLLNEFSLPFDSYTFRNRLNIERQASEMLNGKLEYILQEYFGYDIRQETSKLVREVAVLLPYVNMLRGDFNFLKTLLRSLFHCEVVMNIGRYSHIDTTVCWLPRIIYQLNMPGLSPEAYRQRDAELQPLRDFLMNWFIPFDAVCEIVIKDRSRSNHSTERLILGYNTEVKSE